MITVHLLSLAFALLCCVANATDPLLDLLRPPKGFPNGAIHLIADYDTVPSLDLQRPLEALVALLPQHVTVYINTATDTCGPDEIVRQLRTQVDDSYANDANLKPVIDINGLLDLRPYLLHIVISNIRVNGERLRWHGGPAILFRTFCDSTNCLVQQSPQLHVFDVVDLGHIGVRFTKVHPMMEFWRRLGQFGRKSPHNLQNFYRPIPDTVAASGSVDDTIINVESDERNMIPVTLTESEAAHPSLERIMQQIVMRTRHYVTIRLPHQLQRMKQRFQLIAVKLQVLMERIKQRFVATGDSIRHFGSEIASFFSQSLPWCFFTSLHHIGRGLFAVGQCLRYIGSATAYCITDTLPWCFFTTLHHIRRAFFAVCRFLRYIGSAIAYSITDTFPWCFFTSLHHLRRALFAAGRFLRYIGSAIAFSITDTLPWCFFTSLHHLRRALFAVGRSLRYIGSAIVYFTTNTLPWSVITSLHHMWRAVCAVGGFLRYVGSAIVHFVTETLLLWLFTSLPYIWRELCTVGVFLLLALDGLIYATDLIRFRKIDLLLHLWNRILLPMFQTAFDFARRMRPAVAAIARFFRFIGSEIVYFITDTLPWSIFTSLHHSWRALRAVGRLLHVIGSAIVYFITDTLPLIFFTSLHHSWRALCAIGQLLHFIGWAIVYFITDTLPWCFFTSLPHIWNALCAVGRFVRYFCSAMFYFITVTLPRCFLTSLPQIWRGICAVGRLFGFIGLRLLAFLGAQIALLYLGVRQLGRWGAVAVNKVLYGFFIVFFGVPGALIWMLIQYCLGRTGPVTDPQSDLPDF